MAITAIVATLGREPRLAACLDALAGCRRVVVLQGEAPPQGSFEELIELPRPVGFARAVNRGLAAVRTPFVAIVNDDCIVEPGWADVLAEALEADPGVGAVQGINRREDGLVDGAGIGWNRRFEAIQRELGSPPATITNSGEIFGVSATAALYRHSALPERGFDPVLGTWYEDVELAAWLRHRGWRSRLAVETGALHVGGATTTSLGLSTSRRLANRWLVLARILGRSLPLVVPAALRADLSRLRQAPAEVVPGWCRALALLPSFVRPGPAWFSPAELRSWR